MMLILIFLVKLAFELLMVLLLPLLLLKILVGKFKNTLNFSTKS